ncbi:unnamed protein product [Ectocarpus sp. 6 AP-2014]
MNGTGPRRGGGAASAAAGNDALIDSGIATLERATSMDKQGQLEEAFTLYESGIDLLLQGARQEPGEQRRQTLLNEARVHMSRAEHIKLALGPPQSPSPTRPASAGRRDSGKGKAALLRPKPTAADVRGGLRGGSIGAGSPDGENRAPRSSGGGKSSAYTRGGARRGGGGIGAASGRGTSSAYTRGGAGRGGGGIGASSGHGASTRSGAGRGRGGIGAGSAAAGTGGGGARGGGRREKSENSELENKILEDMLDSSPGVTWDSIAGLEYAKQTLQETVILPNLRPDLFTGLRAPARGVLLYGPPGTGKTMLAKAVATESGYAFFNISASSLTSKYVGEGEKMVRALFAVAREREPAVVFIDEIDSVLSARGEGEHEASRRLKTEFLVQLDGAGQGGDDRLLVLAATNLPQELDEAALRRLSRRVYVPLPDPPARKALISGLLGQQKGNIKGASLASLVDMTEGYSGSDLKQLCKEAAMQPIRADLGTRVRTVAVKDVRGINLDDFRAALPKVLPSVSRKTVERYEEWNRSLSG